MTQRQDVTAIIKDKRGRVLSIGKNTYTKSHTLMHTHAKKFGMPYKIFPHAEVSAIINCRDLSKAYKIEVYRYNKKGKTLFARPCEVCESAIKSTPIKVIEHT